MSAVSDQLSAVAPDAVQLPRFFVTCANDGFEATSYVKVAHNLATKRIAGSDKVVKDLVGYVLVKDSLVSIGEYVELQRLQFDDLLIGDIFDANNAEIGLPGSRTNRGKFRATDLHLVLAAWILVRKSLKLGRH